MIDKIKNIMKRTKFKKPKNNWKKITHREVIFLHWFFIIALIAALVIENKERNNMEANLDTMEMLYHEVKERQMKLDSANHILIRQSPDYFRIFGLERALQMEFDNYQQGQEHRNWQAYKGSDEESIGGGDNGRTRQ